MCKEKEKDVQKKPSLKERYARIKESKWFKEAYYNKSIGEIIEVDND